MTIEEAKAMMTPEAIEKLRTLVKPEQAVKIATKLNNDILMNALCVGVENGIIQKSSLDDRLRKLLASKTNTLQEQKFLDIVNCIRVHQPDIVCNITLCANVDGALETSAEWTIDGSWREDSSFFTIFEYVVKRFNITPQSVRQKLGAVLKLTIVNNVSQLIAKYLSDPKDAKDTLRVSINTITRLVNMEQHLLTASFEEAQHE